MWSLYGPCNNTALLDPASPDPLDGQEENNDVWNHTNQFTGIRQGMGWGIELCYQKQERKSRAREGTGAQNPPPPLKKNFTPHLPWVNGPQIRSYRLSILKVYIEVCSEQNYRISSWKEISVFIDLFRHFTPLIKYVPRKSLALFLN